MYRCTNCGGSFSYFEKPGQCPLCKVWAVVKCTSCGFTDSAITFIQNLNKCPKCGAAISWQSDPAKPSKTVECIYNIVCEACGKRYSFTRQHPSMLRVGRRHFGWLAYLHEYPEAMPVVPCPDCNYIQSSMIESKRRKIKILCSVVLSLTIISMCCATIFCVCGSSNAAFSRYPMMRDWQLLFLLVCLVAWISYQICKNKFSSYSPNWKYYRKHKKKCYARNEPDMRCK